MHEGAPTADAPQRHHSRPEQGSPSECFYNRTGVYETMPQFTAQVFKSHPFLPGRNFSNNYTLLAASLEDAQGGLDTLVEYEREIYDPNFTITYVRLSTAQEDDNVYTTAVYNLAGVRVASGESLPLFNTMRLDVNASTGRP